VVCGFVLFLHNWGRISIASRLFYFRSVIAALLLGFRAQAKAMRGALHFFLHHRAGAVYGWGGFCTQGVSAYCELAARCLSVNTFFLLPSKTKNTCLAAPLRCANKRPQHTQRPWLGLTTHRPLRYALSHNHHCLAGWRGTTNYLATQHTRTPNNQASYDNITFFRRWANAANASLIPGNTLSLCAVTR